MDYSLDADENSCLSVTQPDNWRVEEVYMSVVKSFCIQQLNNQDDTDAARRRLQASSGDKDDINLEERAVLMQKEIMEQETLLQGYQQVNIRISATWYKILMSVHIIIN